jgi:hypothetical protein
MIEVLPRLYLETYEARRTEKFFHRHKIHVIVQLSEKEKSWSGFEEVRIPVKNPAKTTMSVDHLNRFFYSYLYDLIQFLYRKIIVEGQNVCIVGYQEGHEADAVLIAYFLQFAEVSYEVAHGYVMSKKMDAFYERNIYYDCLQKFHYDVMRLISSK